MTVGPPTMCEMCKHFQRSTKSCSAFPNGIPSELHPWGMWDHRKPIDGDGGVQFEPSPDREPDLIKFTLDWFDEDQEALAPDVTS